MNLAYRDIRHNVGRFLLTCVGLGLLLGGELLERRLFFQAAPASRMIPGTVRAGVATTARSGFCGSFEREE